MEEPCPIINDSKSILEHNEDYQLLSHAVNVLQQQYKNCKEDIDKLVKLKEEALNDPISYISKLEDGEIEPSPTLQTVSLLPELSLDKYQRIYPIHPRRNIQYSTEEKMIEALISRINQLQQMQRRPIQPAKIVPEYTSDSPTCILKDTKDIFKDFLPIQEYKPTNLSSEGIAWQSDSSNTDLLSPNASSLSIDGDSIKRQKNNSGSVQRGRPPGTIRRIPWTEQEVSKLKTWISDHPQELSLGNYENIMKELKYRTIYEIRNKIQNIQHQELLIDIPRSPNDMDDH
jgi:hypothetical protein